MANPLDTLFYQWVVDEDSKSIPTVMEDIAQLGDDDKINHLLEVFAHLTADVMESSMAHQALIEQYTDQAMSDPEILENADADDIAAAIQEMEDVSACSEAVDAAARRLDLFQTALVRSLTVPA